MIVRLALFLEIKFPSPNCREIEMVRNVNGLGSGTVGLWISHALHY